jgi:hypothetical protein
MRLLLRLCLPSSLLLLSACAPPAVVKQEIPVSSNPMGATLLVDGTAVGTTPKRIALERNQNYILTLVKDGYEQENVPIRRRYQSDRVLMTAVQSGVNSALFFKDSGMGVQRGLSSISAQEATGEAYVLEPATVSVDLRPIGSPRAMAAASSGPNSASRSTASGAAPERTPSDRGGADEGADAGSVLGASPRTLATAGALAAAASVPAQEKRWTTSSSTKTRVRGDGSVVTRSSQTSVGVGIDPVGLVNLVDTLFTSGGLQ